MPGSLTVQPGQEQQHRPGQEGRDRADGLALVALGSAIFVLLGGVLVMKGAHPVSDFRFLYEAARSILRGTDPYRQGEALKMFASDGVSLGSGVQHTLNLETARLVYLPTGLVLLPLALLSWTPANLLWTGLIAVSFLLCGLLMFEAAARYRAGLAGLAVCLLYATSMVLLILGNPAGVAVTFSVAAAWCLVRERLVGVGVVLLALALMVKPQDAGLVWLYFILAGGACRRRALATLGTAALLGAPLFAAVTLIAPAWPLEIARNLGENSARGHILDPGLHSLGGHGTEMIVDLQTVFSWVRDDPRFYNPASYLVCGVLLLLWALITLRSHPSPSRAWLALGTIAPLSMLPTYHRLYDTRLLLLTIPACALLAARGGRTGRMAILVTLAGILLTGDIQWALFLVALNRLGPGPGWFGPLRIAVQVLPVPLTLLAMTIFYLWAYAREAGAAPGEAPGVARRQAAVALPVRQAMIDEVPGTPR